MSKRRKFRNKKAASNQLATHTSGGVNVNAERDVTIGGDVAGRDKISSTQSIETGGGANVGGNVSVSHDGKFVGHDDNSVNNFRQFILSPWAWMGGVVILVIGLTLVAGINNIGPLQTLFPTPTPLAFPPATEGQSLIIVADFEDRSKGTDQGIDPAQYIYEQLTAQAKKDNLDVRIERLRHTVDDNTAHPTGEAYGATLVLWGWYDALTITPRVERIKVRSSYQSTEEGKHLNLADQTKVYFSIVTDLPSQSGYLVFLVLGLDAYAYPARNYDKALTYFDSAIESISANSDVTINSAEAHLFRGNIYLMRDDFDHAIADLDETVKSTSDVGCLVCAYNNLGAAYAKKRDYDRAIVNFDQAIQLRSNYADAYYNRGYAHYYNDDYDHAITDLDQAIQRNPADAAAYYFRGLAYYGKGDTDRAIADYDKAIQLKSDYAEAYSDRGNAYDANGDTVRALADYNQAIQFKPDYAEAYSNRGAAYGSKGDYAHALADFDRAIQLNPDLAEVYYNRGNIYYDRGDYDRALADFNEAIKSASNISCLACAYNHRGLAFTKKGDTDRAIADFDKAIQLKPDLAVAYGNRGDIYLIKGDATRAIADYDQTIQLKPDYANAYNNRGAAFTIKGDYARAIADFKKVLELTSDPVLLLQAKENLKLLGAQ